ncbi:Zinc carboxypeptidase [Microbulbifer aggregans]|uniref:Zinc carboxypeptidase n=1 Tax=Microbulbifer aggregans TaxID=1769779 RepID=A0A1C9WAT3_9GAMM|nr:M14 family metallopeptidase [Microbulbifer aggregans]AOS98243.1 Zinc carboxypeptidase [Microbulbifer aggregans]
MHKAISRGRARLLAGCLLATAPLWALTAQANELEAPLPKLLPWEGASEKLIMQEGEWVTPAEASGFATTPNYRQTRAFVQQLAKASPDITARDIGTSSSGRRIQLVTLTEGGSDPRSNGKPTLLVQAGIHSGEIDGKDASFMLLRDYIGGDQALRQLIQQANLLIIPILNVDGHERSGPFTRMNQRGPENSGWRTNSNNLNLNRDYAKLDTPELRAVMEIVNEYQPTLYLDVHVTDGEDYQYDITYGYNGSFASDSPAIARWLETRLQNTLDTKLTEAGHIPGPLIFGVNSKNFADGINHWTASPRFSNGLGDLRHLPTVLVENHSLKPYRQRVLGTYVLIEAALQALAEDGKQLQKAIATDQQRRPENQVLAWSTNKTPDTTVFGKTPFKGIAYKKEKNPITGDEQVVWLGKAKDYPALPVFIDNVKSVEVRVPKAFFIPKSETLALERLKAHGIESTEPEQKTVTLTQLNVDDHNFATEPFEGHFRVSATFSEDQVERNLADYVKVSTNQPLGKLAVALLDPRGPDSFFQWGFFNGIFQRTEYYEPYALVPLAEKMLEADAALKEEFEKKLQDKEFANDPRARLEFFYQRGPYYDGAYLKYPVLIKY